MFVCFMYAIPLDGVSESLVRQHLGLFLFIMQRMQRITYRFNVRIGQDVEIIQLCLNSSNELFFGRAGRFLFLLEKQCGDGTRERTNQTNSYNHKHGCYDTANK